MNNQTTISKDKHMNASDGFTKSMSRNLNIYRHVMDNCGANQMNWVQLLRQKDKTLKDKLSKIPDQTFNVYGVPIESQKEGRKIIDYKIRGNTADINHLYNKRIKLTPNFSHAYFEGNLRSCKKEGEQFEKFNSTMKDREQSYWNTAYKDKKGQTECPTFMITAKEEKNMRNTLKNEEEGNTKESNIRVRPLRLRYSAFDGRHNNREYAKVEKCARKNVNEFDTIFRRSCNMPTANWTMSLRG